mmetsp:Transcript_38651/g.82361  ORF Transcript_38651/g.82361 Transcript_38651/m.82361 type:complete len:210 (-) Transcript_38651:104-733(-)
MEWSTLNCAVTSDWSHHSQSIEIYNSASFYGLIRTSTQNMPGTQWLGAQNPAQAKANLAVSVNGEVVEHGESLLRRQGGVEGVRLSAHLRLDLRGGRGARVATLARVEVAALFGVELDDLAKRDELLDLGLGPRLVTRRSRGEGGLLEGLERGGGLLDVGGPVSTRDEEREGVLLAQDGRGGGRLQPVDARAVDSACLEGISNRVGAIS